MHDKYYFRIRIIKAKCKRSLFQAIILIWYYNEGNILRPPRFGLAMDQVDKWDEYLRLHGNVRAVHILKELLWS